MRILIISDVPLSDDNSVGNTYSNIFNNLEDATFANLYCKAGKPNSRIISRYMQITEKQLLLDMLGKKKENESMDCHVDVFNKQEQRIYDIVRTLRFQSFFLVRELIWKIGRWKNEELNTFLNEFNPDIIFSFCLDSFYYIDLIDYCRNYSVAKLVLFFADDVYNYTKKNPLYLIYKYFSRQKIKKIVKNVDKIYGATPQLCSEYSAGFKKKINLLYKVCEEVPMNKVEVGKPLKITYTGNLFYGRWKTLALVAKAVKEINIDSDKAQLNIYTSGLITKKMDNLLNIEGASKLVGTISYEHVKEILKQSDVVLHVESFNKQEIKKTRLSFSTKIVDCMQSGSCLLAVGPEETSSIKLLKDYDIAQVVTDNNKNSVKSIIMKLIENERLITSTAHKMNQFAIENHSLNYLKDNLYTDLKALTIEDNV